jgi:hypothetical protein
VILLRSAGCKFSGGFLTLFFFFGFFCCNRADYAQQKGYDVRPLLGTNRTKAHDGLAGLPRLTTALRKFKKHKNVQGAHFPVHALSHIVAVVVDDIMEIPPPDGA